MTDLWRQELVHILDMKKARHIESLSLKSSLADYFIIASADSSRHLWTLCETIERHCKEKGFIPLVQGRETNTRWIVMDVQGIFVHLFLEEARAYYELESLWSSSKEASSINSMRKE